MQDMKEFANLAEQLQREQENVSLPLLKSLAKIVVKNPEDVVISEDFHVPQNKFNVFFKESKKDGHIYALIFKNVESGFQPVVVFCFFVTDDKDTSYKKKLVENWYRSKAKSLELQTINFIRYAEHRGDWHDIVVGFVQTVVYWIWFLDNSPTMTVQAWAALQTYKKQRDTWFDKQHERAKRYLWLPTPIAFVQQYWTEGTVAHRIYQWLNSQSDAFFRLYFDDEDVISLLIDMWDEHTGQELVDKLGGREFRRLLAIYADSME